MSKQSIQIAKGVNYIVVLDGGRYEGPNRIIKPRCGDRTNVYSTGDQLIVTGPAWVGGFRYNTTANGSSDPILIEEGQKAVCKMRTAGSGYNFAVWEVTLIEG